MYVSVQTVDAWGKMGGEAESLVTKVPMNISALVPEPR